MSSLLPPRRPASPRGSAPASSTAGKSRSTSVGARIAVTALVISTGCSQLSPNPPAPGRSEASSQSGAPATAAAAPTSQAPTPSRSPTSAASGPDPTGDAAPLRLDPARQSAIAAALDGLAEAGRRRHAGSWSSRIDPRSADFAGTAATVYRNLGALRPASLTLTPTGEVRPLSGARRARLGDQALAVQVRLAWRLSGERWTSQSTVWMSLAPSRSGWRWAGTGDGPQLADPDAAPIWWLEPVSVRSSHQATVLAGRGADPAVWLRRAVRAGAQVADQTSFGARGVPGPSRGWDRRLVLEIPSSESVFEQLVGVTPGSDSQLAAVSFPDGPDAARAPIRIMVNPAALRNEPELGIDLVLTHEATHVATHSPASPAPLWLVEGYADDQAFRAYPQASASQLQSLYRSVRQQGAPRAVPDDDSFGPQAGDLDLAYAEAWQLCAYLSARSGPSALNAFYTAANRRGDVDAALEAVYGIDSAQLVRGWRSALTSAAHR